MNLDADCCKVEMGDNEIHLINGVVTVSYDMRMGTISLVSDEKTCFSRGYILVHTDRQVYDSRKMTYRSFSALDFHEESIKGKAVILKVQDGDKTADLSIKLSVYENLPGFTVVIQYRNRGEEVKVKSIDALVIDVDDSSRVITGWNNSDLRFFRNGFHSWELSQAHPVDVGENLSHFYSVLNNIKTKESLLFGFTTLADQLSTITANGREKEKSRLALVAATSHADDIPVTEKDMLVSEEMMVLYSDNAIDSLKRYMDFVALRMDAILWENVPTGWCSWYFYYTMPDEGEIRDNVNVIKKRFDDAIEWIQIDDGFQKKVGDWEENARFASGLGALVKDIKEKGYRAGVWVAPFVASQHSELFKDKPDWFVKDQDNVPIPVDENPLWLGKYYALDLSNPKVIAYVKKVFKKLKEDGFDYFKIDFLYFAAIEGLRKNQKMTRAQVVRQGLQAIRDTVGDDLILGCGAPLGPCVGVTNMMRIGTDIATDWRYDWGAGVYECSVNTMTRAIMHDRLWINDPDCVLVRQDDNNLTLEEVKLWLSVTALSGGAILLSDRMMEVSEERMHLLDKVLPPYRESAVALDSLEKKNPSVFVQLIKREGESWGVFGAINLNEAPIDVTFTLDSIGLDADAPHHVFDFWSQKYHGLSEGEVSVLSLKPHSCKILLVKQEKDIPMVLSTSMHISQGAVEISDVDWNAGGKELSMRVIRNNLHEESIFVVFSEDWIPSRAYVDDKEVTMEQIAPEVIAVKFKFAKDQIVKVRFSQ
jgi:alpha-galactosidase